MDQRLAKHIDDIGREQLEVIIASVPRPAGSVKAYTMIDITPLLAREFGLKFPAEATTQGRLRIKTFWHGDKRERLDSVLEWERTPREIVTLGRIE